MQCGGELVGQSACKLAGNRRLQQSVAFKLSQNWSPEQVARWQRYRTTNACTSHETIYRSLFIKLAAC